MSSGFGAKRLPATLRVPAVLNDPIAKGNLADTTEVETSPELVNK